jgi:tetratricopeptide (TPR) repeat protein
MGDKPAAIALYHQALEVLERAEGEGLRVATVLINIGELYAFKDRKTARKFLERAKVIFERQVGFDHPDMALTYNNLALLCQREGDLAGARDHLENALKITENMLGPDDPRVGYVLANLARNLYMQRDQSWPKLSKRAIEIFVENQHPDVRWVQLGHWWQYVFWYVGPWLGPALLVFLLWLLWRLLAWLFI